MVAFLIVILVILPLTGCVSLPNTSELIKASQQTCVIPKMVGPRRHLSGRQSKAVIKRLAQQSLPEEFLDRHIRVEELLCGAPLIAGNDVRLLVDGPATYGAMVQAISNAKDHINIETYIFRDDEIGHDFAKLLIQKRAEGVTVNLIYDSIGSRSTSSEFFQRLRDGGINLLEFNPLNPLLGSSRWKLTHRDHRKILVVDGTLAITGGVNITSDYSPSLFKSVRKRKERFRTFWRDTDVQIEGPAVAEFQKLFLETWKRQEGPELPERNYFPSPERKGDGVVRVIGSSPDTRNGLTFMMYVAAISFARKSVHLTNSYFVPDKQMIKALTGAAKRGVDVKIILPASSDSPMAVNAGRSHYRRLLEAGVKLYEHTTTILHAKTAVIDGVWSSVGSTNMDLWSFARNDEVNAVILGADFADQMESMFQKDLENSREITLEVWKKRPVGQRLKEWLSRRLSYWL